MTALLVALGGAVGAVLRYVLDRSVHRLSDSDFPFGTLSVNVLGSAVLGLLAGLALNTPDGALGAAVGVGLCGSMTTFSTFGYETVQLFTEKARLHAAVNVLGTVAAGLTAAGAGLLAASWF